MRIIGFSDTHNYHRKVNIPDGDVLVCCGDITGNGQLEVIKDFADWMKQFPHSTKISIFGNHDRFQERNVIRDTAIQYLIDAGISYLEDSKIIINGIKFYGSPWTPTYGEYSFMSWRGQEIANKWSSIPNDVNVLITHGPPNGIGDEVSRGFWFGESVIENVGCVDLLNKIKGLKQLKAHLFGHIHSGSGIKIINNIKFANCSICDAQNNPINSIRIIDV